MMLLWAHERLGVDNSSTCLNPSRRLMALAVARRITLHVAQNSATLNYPKHPLQRLTAMHRSLEKPPVQAAYLIWFVPPKVLCNDVANKHSAVHRRHAATARNRVIESVLSRWPLTFGNYVDSAVSMGEVACIKPVEEDEWYEHQQCQLR